MNCWVEPDTRDAIVDYIAYWKNKTSWTQRQFCQQLQLSEDRLCDWRRRYGQANQHNGKMPRHFWLTNQERQAIVDFYLGHEEDGYRRCSYMMIDRDIAYASPSSVYRVLKRADVLRPRHGRRSKRGRGFDQPAQPHQHWHTDISYVKVANRFYFLICVLDGYSRYIVHHDLREEMTADDVGIVMQAAVEQHPGERPRTISDNGKQFTGKEFRTFIARHGLTHTTTSAYYPQSNGKLERFHGSIKSESLNRKYLNDHDHAKQVIQTYVDYYNHQRLHSAIGYITPADMLAGHAEHIHAERDRKLEAARRNRKQRFLSSDAHTTTTSERSGAQDAGRISAPCGPSETGAAGKRVMPARDLNDASIAVT